MTPRSSRGQDVAEAKAAFRDRFHPEARFGDFTDIDGTLMFYARVQELLYADAVALDIGCGRGSQADDPVRIRRDLRILRGKCRHVIGIDVDPAAGSNDFIDEFRLIDGAGQWPIGDEAVDVALADFVLEHVREPGTFFAQAARVIRPGGYLCIRTTNRRSYLGLASLLVPNRLHRQLLRVAQPTRRGDDVFEAYYRCNTIGGLRSLLGAHGFDCVVYGAEAEPAYLTFNPLLYGLGLAHRRLAPSSLRVGIQAWARRCGP